MVIFAYFLPSQAHAETQKTANCLGAHFVKASVEAGKRKRHSGTYGKGDYYLSIGLELAATPETRSKGLMDRDSIGPCDGMAFFFPSAKPPEALFRPQRFWMKNTRIPLDVLFIDAEAKIIAIEHGVPQSTAPFGPQSPIATVIEIDAGRAAKEGIVVGDTVHYDIQTQPHMLAR